LHHYHAGGDQDKAPIVRDFEALVAALRRYAPRWMVGWRDVEVNKDD
jgi:hypothetical protein